MNRFKKWIPTKRKIVQLYLALLFNANVHGFVSGVIFKGATKNACVPGLNCYSCPGAVGACPLGSLQGSFSADRSTLFYVCGILLLYGVLFGRLICGWMCPFGLIQELVYKIKTPKLKKNRVTRVLSYAKYVILGFFVVAVPLMYAFRDVPLPAFCKYICPAGTLEGGIGLLSNVVNDSYFRMLGPLFTWKFLLLVSIVTASVFLFRFFCRFLCPLGALYGFFNRVSFFGVKVNESACTHCTRCVAHCKMDVNRVGDHECISCGECISVCPTDAIVWKGIPKKKATTPGDTVKGHKAARTVTRVIAGVAAVALLGGVMTYTWIDSSNRYAVTTPANPDNNESDKPPVGYEVGNSCPSGDLSIVNGDGISEQTIDPSKTGTVTVINFWGTWCTPCVKELPYFDQIATEYAETVSVIAIHTDMIIDTAPTYLAQYYPDSRITFARDLAGEGYYASLGGRGTYPYTVVLDENGVIANVFVSALTYDDLKEAVDALM